MQDEVLVGGGTDAGMIQISRSGVYTGAISIPSRYVHNPVEMCDIRDAEACVELTLACADIALE